MISAQSLAIVEATVEVVRENGTAITRCFYRNMFSAHPELKSLFNMGNQASGEQPQALANAVYAYAANIQQPQKLEPVLSRIAHKHASLGVKPAEYTIVGKHLLEAVAEILGEAATAEILAAWGEVYWLMACELIAREARLYVEQSAQLGDAYWRDMVIHKKVIETDQIVSLYLQYPDQRKLPEFKPGQYISVVLPLSNADYPQQIRQYSLSDAPRKPSLRITIKQEKGNGQKPAGLVSPRISALQAGDLLKVGHPYGDFVLEYEDQKPVVLMSAGVGIAPVIGMLNELTAQQAPQPVRFLHAAKSASHVPLRDDIQNAANQLADFKAMYFFEQLDGKENHGHPGYMDVQGLGQDILPEDAHYYLCGPIQFMQVQRQALLDQGIDAEQIQNEVFGPDLLVGLR